MSKSFIGRMQHNRGFTIVELLIVIVVIAILAAIVIVAYNGIQGRAIDSSVRSSVQSAATKIQTYAIQNNDTFPATLAAININDSATTTFAYTFNNSTSPKTYCVSATTNSVSYYITNAIPTPTSGACTVATTSTVFGASYPYTPTLYNDGDGTLKLITGFYSTTSSFVVKGGRVYLPSVPSSVSLTIFYEPSWHTGDTHIAKPVWSSIPSGISGQYVTIPNSSLVVGWNEVTFPTPATISPLMNTVDGTAVWIGYYFSDGTHYMYTASPTSSPIQSSNNGNLYLAPATGFDGNTRSANPMVFDVGYGPGWSTALYGIDIITQGP